MNKNVNTAKMPQLIKAYFRHKCSILKFQRSKDFLEIEAIDREQFNSDARVTSLMFLEKMLYLGLARKKGKKYIIDKEKALAWASNYEPALAQYRPKIIKELVI